MKHILLIALLVGVISYTSYSQDEWSSLSLPATLNTPITSNLVSGNDFYIGTNGQGVFDSNDSGQTWSNSSLPGQMLTEPINNILISKFGYVFAFGTNTIFRSRYNLHYSQTGRTEAKLDKHPRISIHL